MNSFNRESKSPPKLSFGGLSVVNVELTSRCDKLCWMCPWRKLEKRDWGDMDFALVKSIAEQLPPDILVTFHISGEPLVYPRFGEAVALFKNQIKFMDTNAKLLVEKADEVIDNMDVIGVSAFQGDPEADEQYRTIEKFLEIKGDRKPRVIIRYMGGDPKDYYSLGCPVVTREFDYQMYGKRHTPIIPEYGICIEALTHLAIKRTGKVSMCVRFDPEDEGCIGTLPRSSLIDVWAGKQRKKYISLHKQGRRQEIPLCNHCDYWGIPC